MQTFIIKISFALVTLTALLTTPPVLQRPEPSEPIPVLEPKLSAVKPSQATVLPQDPEAAGEADLSIGIAIAQPNPNPPTIEARSIKLAKNQPTIMELHLGEDLDDQEVILNFPDHSVEYRVFQRYRTSMSIANEGPHLDLVDWRHFDSRWFQLPSSGPRRFHTLRTDQMDSVRFPPTTQAEILDEVRRQVGSDSDVIEFIDVAESCHGPNDGACWVGISSIYLRVQKRVGSDWIDFGLVEFRLPMGC